MHCLSPPSYSYHYFLTSLIIRKSAYNNCTIYYWVVLRQPPPPLFLTKSPVSKPTPGRTSWNTMPLPPRRHRAKVLVVLVVLLVVVLCKLENIWRVFVSNSTIPRPYRSAINVRWTKSLASGRARIVESVIVVSCYTACLLPSHFFFLFLLPRPTTWCVM